MSAFAPRGLTDADRWWREHQPKLCPCCGAKVDLGMPEWRVSMVPTPCTWVDPTPGKRWSKTRTPSCPSLAEVVRAHNRDFAWFIQRPTAKERVRTLTVGEQLRYFIWDGTPYTHVRAEGYWIRKKATSSLRR